MRNIAQIAFRLYLIGWLLFPHQASAQASVDEATQTAAAQAKAAMSALQQNWLVQKKAGDSWAQVNAWQRFVIIDAGVDYTTLTGDREFMPQVERGVIYRHGLDGNDDDLWAVIAALKVYTLDGNSSLLTYAEHKHHEIVQRYWDGKCGGGLWWDHKRTYKNAITNELLAYASLLLYRHTGEKSYLNWGKKALDWFNTSGMINARHLVNDGLDAHCANNLGVAYTYNQGVILGALTQMYQLTGTPAYLDEATQLASASIAYSKTEHQVLHEPVDKLSKDAQSFKGIYIQHLASLATLVKDPLQRRSLDDFIRNNARSVWKKRESGSDRLNAYWDGEGLTYGAAAQASGIDALNASLLTAASDH